MFHNLHYAYIVADMFLLLIWAIFFIARKDLRREMIIVSILAAPFGLTQYFFGADYWHPSYIISFGVFGIEDLLYMFATGGIIGVIYEEFFGKRFSKRHMQGHPYFAVALTIFGLFAVFVGTAVLHINSIYISSITFLFAGIVTIIIRKDLFKHAFYSGLLLGLITLFFEIFILLIFPNLVQSWWLLDNISRIFVFGIPIEELLFAFTFGFVAGPMYEFVFGLRLKK